MPQTSPTESPAPLSTEHFDVLIVGAGISGVGGAYHLTRTSARGQELRRARSAGELRRHLADAQVPGHPLRQRPLHLRLPLQALDRAADRDRRRDPEVHGRGDRRERPRPAHPLPPQITSASWSSADNLWTDRGQRTDTGERAALHLPTSCGCARATTATRRATRPSGRAWTEFKGQIVHPQTWPEDLDYKGKNVLVIGSGATTATVVPAIAGDCEHVTVLQRSPTYFIPGATPTSWPTRCASSRSTRPGSTRSCGARSCTTRRCSRRRFDRPETVRKELLNGVRAYLGPRTTSKSTSRRATGRGSSASRSCPMATCSRASSAGKAVGGHRRDRDASPRRHPAQVGRGARGRHHRHRDRLQPERARRHRVHVDGKPSTSPTRSPIAA
jgi:hypothetical protein